MGWPQRGVRSRLNRSAHRNTAHVQQPVKGRDQVAERRQPQHRQGVTSESGEPMAGAVGDATAWPAAADHPLVQRTADGRRIGLVSPKETLRTQPDHAPALRTAVAAHRKGAGKAFENHQRKAVDPYRAMATAATAVRSRPGIIAGTTRNLVEIQSKKRYHRITVVCGGLSASRFAGGGCGCTHRPVFPNKNSPCAQGPFNLKFPAFLSTHCEIHPAVRNTLLRDPTLSDECGDRSERSCIGLVPGAAGRELVLLRQVLPLGRPQLRHPGQPVRRQRVPAGRHCRSVKSGRQRSRGDAVARRAAAEPARSRRGLLDAAGCVGQGLGVASGRCGCDFFGCDDLNGQGTGILSFT